MKRESGSSDMCSICLELNRNRNQRRLMNEGGEESVKTMYRFWNRFTQNSCLSPS